MTFLFSNFSGSSMRLAHLEDLDHNLLIVSDVDSLEHLTVLPSAQLTDQLVVLLVAAETNRRAACVTKITQKSIV